MIPYENWGHIGASSPPAQPTSKERANGRLWLALIAALFLLLAFAGAGCRTSHPVDERPNAGMASHAVGLDTSKVGISHTAFATTAQTTDSQAKAGLLSGIGNLFSTPEGRANRQAVKLAKAGVPRSIKVKDGAFAWGTYAKAANAGKKANQATDSATQQVATNAVAGKGNTATQTATTEEAPGLLATLGKPVGYVLAVVLAGAAAYLVYLIWAFLPRRKDNTA